MPGQSNGAELAVPEAWLGGVELKEGLALNLVASKCSRCGAVFFPSYTACVRCGSKDCSPTRLSSTGAIYSFTTVHRAPAEFAVPYRVAWVLFPEGPLVFSQLVGDGEPKIGDEVEVVLGKLSGQGGGGGRWAYVFRLKLPEGRGES
jgi:uncharacterized OB-fold protein